MKYILPTFGIFLAIFGGGIISCGPDSLQKESQSIVMELPSTPPHVAKYVNFNYTLVCGGQRFTKSEVKESQLVFKEIKGLAGGSKCFLEVGGDATRFRDQHKDATFVQPPTSQTAQFYMSSEAAVVDSKVAFSLYPLFKLGSQSQTTVKMAVKAVAKDGKPLADIKTIQQWSLVCDTAKTVALNGTPTFNNTDQWTLDFSFISGDLGPSKKDQCQLTATVGPQTYGTEKVSINLENTAAVSVTLKPIESPPVANAGNIKVNVTIEPKKK